MERTLKGRVAFVSNNVCIIAVCSPSSVSHRHPYSLTAYRLKSELASGLNVSPLSLPTTPALSAHLSAGLPCPAASH